MQKILLTFTIILLVSVSSNSFALEKGTWTLTKNNDWCYIGSLPIKSDLSETKKRGENYILVYKIIKIFCMNMCIFNFIILIYYSNKF